MQAIDLLVQPAQERDGLEVLASAVDVGDPLALLAGVVEVEHGGHRIDAQAVGVVDVEPVLGAAQQEASHLVAAVVEDEAVPVRVQALPRVAVLVEVRSVEVAEAVVIGREVRRHPVEDHADAVLVQHVDEVHEVLGRAVAARGREVARRLVAPGAVEGMLHDRQQLDVREALGAGVLRQQRRQLAEAQHLLRMLRGAPPGAEVHLVDRDRRREGVAAAARPHPFLVVPGVVERRHDRGRRRRYLVR